MRKRSLDYQSERKSNIMGIGHGQIGFNELRKIRSIYS